ncbi:MAG: hypothetical protein ACRDKJ_05320 [Actinomycetota bacterium]
MKRLVGLLVAASFVFSACGNGGEEVQIAHVHVIDIDGDITYIATHHGLIEQQT